MNTMLGFLEVCLVFFFPTHLKNKDNPKAVGPWLHPVKLWFVGSLQSICICMCVGLRNST